MTVTTDAIRTWQAMHEPCPPGGCSTPAKKGCTTLEVDFTDDEWDNLTATAHRCGMTLPELIHLALWKALLP